MSHNGLYNGLLSGAEPGLFDGISNGLHNGLVDGETKIIFPSTKNYVLFDKTFDSDTNGFTNNGATISISSNRLQLSGGTNTFTKYVSNTAYGSTNLNNWSLECIWVVGSLSATTDFMGIGVQGDSSFGGAGQICGGFLVSTSGTIKGQINIYKGSGTILGSSPTKVAFSLGDTIQYIFSLSGQTLTMKARNLTTNGDYSVATATPSMASTTSGFLVNTGKFALTTFSGTAEIVRFRGVSENALNPKIVFVGDSKTNGFSAGSFDLGWGSRVMAGSSSSYAIVAKVNSVTQDVLNAITELERMKPRYVALAIGRNDVSSGVSTATWQANYSEIVRRLKAVGSKIIHVSPTGETSLNQTALYNYQKSFTQDVFVDVLTNFNNATMLSADNVHENAVGHQFKADQFRAIVPYSYY